MNIHCPIIRSKLSKRKTPIKPWITKGLIKSIQTKDKLYKKYIKHPTINNKIIHTKYKNNLTQLLRLSKRNHISSEIELHKHNMKKMWGTLNNLLGRNRKQKLPEFFKNKDGIKVTDSSAIASYFNDFFTNIGSSLADRIPPPDPNFTSPLKSFNMPSTMFLAPTSSDEVDKLVKKMKASTTTGHDGISSSLLKAVLPEINSTLIHIFNLSLSTGVVPSQRSPRLYLSTKLVTLITLTTTGLFLFYLPSPRFLKGSSTTEFSTSYLSTIFFVLTNMVSGLTELPIWHSTTFTRKSPRT